MHIFCLDYQITLLYIQWGHDLDLCCGVEWGLPHPKLLDGSDYFLRSQGQEGSSRYGSWAPVIPSWRAALCGNWQGELVIFQHLVYLWPSGKQKKNKGLLSKLHMQCCLFYQWLKCSCLRGSLVLCAHPPVSVWIIQEKRLPPHHGRGSSVQVISYIDDKNGEKQKQQNGGGWDNREISKGKQLFPPESWEDSGRRCLYQRVHSAEQSSEAWLLSEWGP